MKKKIAVIALAAMLLALCIGSTSAYFTTTGVARNVITTGNVALELNETMLNEQGEEIPFEDQTGVMPGQEVSKIVRVENTGNQPIFVRVSVEKKIELAEGKEGEPDTDLISFDINTEDWEEKDGFYYYKTPVEPGKENETNPLFRKVIFAGKDMDDLYQGCKVTVSVTAYGVQTANNGEKATEADGWPAVQK